MATPRDLLRSVARGTLPPALLGLAACASTTSMRDGSPAQPVIESRVIPVLVETGLRFRDLNRNGRLDPYEDWRLSAAERAHDLRRRMTLEEKAGTMMHANPPSTASATIPGAGTAWDVPGIRSLLLDKHITSFLNRLNTDVADMARQVNALQAMAEQGRLGIPVSLSTDPRNQFRFSQGVSVAAGAFTQWPDPPGMAATGDVALVRRYADSIRQEYLAVGIRVALSPMADLTVNPRWHRTNGTFGSDPAQSARFVRAYVEGMQNGSGGIGRDSVVSVVKHWVGYGATAPDGFDAHNHYGRHLGATSTDIERHIEPFTGAFAARVGGVMPSYSLPGENLRIAGATGAIERVGIGFNRQMLTEVLRGRFGFDGVVVSDWQITDDCTTSCRDGAPLGQKPGPADIAMPWGVDHLSKAERFAKAVHAGVDQFGGAKEPEFIVDNVKAGRLGIDAVDRAVQRILEQKFRQGLFENPYVDGDAASRIVGNAGFKAMALQAQRRSAVLIQHNGGALPLRAAGTRLWLYRVDPAVARQRGFTVVDRPEDADVALMSLSTPYEMLHPQHFFGSRYREGATGFKDGAEDFETFKRVSAMRPTVVSLYLERPADISRLAGSAAAIVGNFGISPEALFDVLTGVHAPQGRLPYDLPWTGAQATAEGLALRLGEGLRY